MTTIYQQTYYGDEEVVGSIIGANGNNVSNYKDTVSLSTSEGILHWIHWDNAEGKWIVRGSTLTVVNDAIRWILSEETRFHLRSYQRQQAHGLENITVIDGPSRSSQPSTSISGAENSNWRDHSQETTTPGSEFYNPAPNRWKRCHIGTVHSRDGDTTGICEAIMGSYGREVAEGGLLRMTDTHSDDEDRIYMQVEGRQILIGYVDEYDRFYFMPRADQ